MMHRLTDAAFALAWAIVKLLPERIAHALANLGADMAWRRRGRGVVQLERNLRRVVGPDPSDDDLRALSRRALRSYGRYWCEAFRLPVWSSSRVIAAVRTEDEKIFRDLIASGRGIVAALPHMANWDLAGAWACMTGAPLTTVAERLRPESLFDRFVAYREGLGMEVLPADGGREVFTTLQQRLRDGGLVCLVADRDMTASGLEIDFFGETASVPSGPAALAVSTGAALMPVSLWYEPNRMVVKFHEEIPVPESGGSREKILSMTHELVRIYEAAIAAHPEDWHMLQRFWPADRRRGG